MTLITAQQTWALWAVLLSCAAFGLWAERTSWGARVSGSVLTILAAFILSNSGIIPAKAAVYDIVWTYLVPFAFPLLLFQANLRRIPRELSFTLGAFVLVVLTVVAATVVAYKIMGLSTHDWRLAAVFSATYIGGPINTVATAKAVGMGSSTVLSASVAAANLVLACYLLIIFLLPSWRWLRESFNEPLTDERWSRTDRIVLSEHRKGSSMSLAGITTAFAVSAVICAIAFGLAPLLRINGGAILIIALISVILATLMPQHVGSINAAEELGMLCMQLLFATIGASANIQLVLNVGTELVSFGAWILLIHLVLLLIIGKFVHLSLPQLLIASNAGVGSAGTAAAMAASRRWRSLLIPAVLCGALGYSVATHVGVLVGGWLR